MMVVTMQYCAKGVCTVGTVAMAVPRQSCVDDSKTVAMALPRQRCADDSVTVAMALPRQSCADVSGRQPRPCDAKALHCQANMPGGRG